MQCSYCRAPFTETSKGCPSCQLSLQSTNALLGPIPRFPSGRPDPQQQRVGLIAGYGLEPFLPRKALDHTLEKAQPSLGTANLTQAILTVIDSLDQLMEGICDGLVETLGVEQAAASTKIQY